MEEKSISVIIPVYNSDKSLKQLVGAFEEEQKNGFLLIAELIFVNDGSKNPKTWETLKYLCKAHHWVKAINLSRNFGQQAATICGLSLARGTFIATMDDDMQHHPKYLKEFIALSEHDAIIGKLKKRKSSIIDKATTWCKNYFDHLILGKPKNLRLSSFRLMKREVVEKMLEVRSVKPFLPALLFYITKDVVNLEFEHELRAEGRSNYTIGKRLKLFSHIIIDNSSIMLKLLMKLAFAVLFLSIIVIIILVVQRLYFGKGLTGWTSTIISIIFMGSLNLLAISIVGEYLSRIFPIVERKPPFVIKESINIKA